MARLPWAIWIPRVIVRQRLALRPPYDPVKLDLLLPSGTVHVRMEKRPFVRLREPQRPMTRYLLAALLALLAAGHASADYLLIVVNLNAKAASSDSNQSGMLGGPPPLAGGQLGGPRPGGMAGMAGMA